MRGRRVILQRFLQIFIGILILLIGSGCASLAAAPSVPPAQVKQHITAMGVQPTSHIIWVDTKKQTLAHVYNDQIKKIYTISTSKHGLGQREHTFQTPQGLHRINEKIGDGVPAYGIFHRRQYVGTAWRPQARKKHQKDYISTRILRLEGLQPGFNKGRDKRGKIVDTAQRAVYIHGTTMEWKLGAPSTKGCVHMSARDVIALFKEIPIGTLVWIN